MRTLFVIIALSLSSFNYASSIQISLQHVFGNQNLELKEQQYATFQGEKITFSRLKYYLGNIVLKYEDGTIYKDAIKYHLVDLEETETMKIELINTPKGKIKQIEFSVGVDSLTNANGLMDGDLDPLKGMYWAWSSGFINFKLEGTCLSCDPVEEFAYHIGGFIAPNQSFQQKILNINKEASQEIFIDVDIQSLFKEDKIVALPKIMSPSKKSKTFSDKLPELFSTKK